MTAAQGVALRDHGQQLCLDATDDDIKAAINDAIRDAAKSGRPFTTNDIRSQFPDAPSALPGALITAAHKAKVIKPTGNYVRSTLKSTRGHVLTEWIGAS